MQANGAPAQRRWWCRRRRCRSRASSSWPRWDRPRPNRCTGTSGPGSSSPLRPRRPEGRGGPGSRALSACSSRATAWPSRSAGSWHPTPPVRCDACSTRAWSAAAWPGAGRYATTERIRSPGPVRRLAGAAGRGGLAIRSRRRSPARRPLGRPRPDARRALGARRRAGIRRLPAQRDEPIRGRPERSGREGHPARRHRASGRGSAPTGGSGRKNDPARVDASTRSCATLRGRPDVVRVIDRGDGLPGRAYVPASTASAANDGIDIDPAAVRTSRRGCCRTSSGWARSDERRIGSIPRAQARRPAPRRGCVGGGPRPRVPAAVRVPARAVAGTPRGGGGGGGGGM